MSNPPHSTIGVSISWPPLAWLIAGPWLGNQACDQATSFYYWRFYILTTTSPLAYSVSSVWPPSLIDCRALIGQSSLWPSHLILLLVFLYPDHHLSFGLQCIFCLTTSSLIDCKGLDWAIQPVTKPPHATTVASISWLPSKLSEKGIWTIFDYNIYRCSKILNTKLVVCQNGLDKQNRPWSSLFVILKSILWIPTLIPNILVECKREVFEVSEHLCRW